MGKQQGSQESSLAAHLLIAATGLFTGTT